MHGLRWPLLTILTSGVFQHAEQVLDDIFAADEVDALQALVGQVTRVAGLPKRHQQRRRSQHLLQR